MLNIRVIKSLFWIGNWKKIQFFKTSFNNKNSISFSHIKFILTLIFAPKMMEFWSFFQFCFWGPLKLLRPLKKAQTLDSWPLTMPLKTRPWIRLVLKKCPVSIGPPWIVLHPCDVRVWNLIPGNGNYKSFPAIVACVLISYMRKFVRGTPQGECLF